MFRRVFFVVPVYIILYTCMYIFMLNGVDTVSA